MPSVVAELCTTAGLAGRPGNDRVVAAVARWRGHHGRFVHRAALTGLARVQTVPDRATLTELVRCLILPVIDGWRLLTPELESVYAASSALSGRRPSEVPYLADLLLARLSRLEPDESSELALPLLMCFAFPDGPLHGEITFAGLTRRQRDVVHVLLDSGALDRDPAVPWLLARYNLPRRSADLSPGPATSGRSSDRRRRRSAGTGRRRRLRGSRSRIDCYVPRVDEDTFWTLIEVCRQESRNDTEFTACVLFRRLRMLDAAGVIEFGHLWERARSTLYSWPVTDAACLLLGLVEEEDLRHVQDWIISYGRTRVERTARDPDSLADLGSDAGNARAGWFDEFTTEAHIIVSGTWPPGHDPEGPEDLFGERTDLGDPDAVPRRFPRLAALRRDHPGLGAPELR